MSYKVILFNGNALLGFLKDGEVSVWPRYYPHPSAARRVAEGYIKRNTSHTFQIVTWRSQ